MLNKIKTAILIIFFGIFTSNIGHAQAALLVLIFGDKVATENFHLSIDFGWNLSSLPGLIKATSLSLRGYLPSLRSFFHWLKPDKISQVLL